MSSRIAQTWIAACALLACSTSPATPVADEAGARAAVERFFAAAAASDCATVQSMVPRASTPERCAELVEELREHHVSLDGIGEVVRDGRDPSAMIVHAHLHGSEADSLIRATLGANGWQVDP